MPDELATPRDAMREYATNVGAEHPEREWILTGYDVWVANPFFNGVPGPHPEEDWD